GAGNGEEKSAQSQPSACHGAWVHGLPAFQNGCHMAMLKRGEGRASRKGRQRVAGASSEARPPDEGQKGVEESEFPMTRERNPISQELNRPLALLRTITLISMHDPLRPLAGSGFYFPSFRRSRFARRAGYPL